MRVRNVEPPVARYLLQEPLLEHSIASLGEEERIRKHSLRVWQVGSPYIACGQRQPVTRRQQIGCRFHQTLTQELRDRVIQSELLIAGVAFIAGKEFIAAIAC